MLTLLRGRYRAPNRPVDESNAARYIGFFAHRVILSKEADMTALASTFRAGMHTLTRLRGEAKIRVDRFEAKARERIHTSKEQLIDQRDRIRTRVLDRLQKAFELPTQKDLDEVKAR